MSNGARAKKLHKFVQTADRGVRLLASDLCRAAENLFSNDVIFSMAQQKSIAFDRMQYIGSTERFEIAG